MEFGAGMAGYAGVCVYNSGADRDDVITVDAATSDTEVERHSCRLHKRCRYVSRVRHTIEWGSTHTKCK